MYNLSANKDRMTANFDERVLSGIIKDTTREVLICQKNQ